MNLANEKLTIGFLADVLYIKEILCYEEFEAIQNVKTAADLEVIVEKMLRGEFNVYRQGESKPRDSGIVR